jgi:hypothetical protein
MHLHSEETMARPTEQCKRLEHKIAESSKQANKKSQTLSQAVESRPFTARME